MQKGLKSYTESFQGHTQVISKRVMLCVQPVSPVILETRNQTVKTKINIVRSFSNIIHVWLTSATSHKQVCSPVFWRMSFQSACIYLFAMFFLSM